MCCSYVACAKFFTMHFKILSFCPFLYTFLTPPFTEEHDASLQIKNHTKEKRCYIFAALFECDVLYFCRLMYILKIWNLNKKL